jgi:tRNA(adenine34) deaminase
MDDDEAMDLALAEARTAFEAGEVPVGAIVLSTAGEVIGRGRNRVVADRDPTAHAEMVAIREASARVGGRLEGATLYATLEPCPMCAGAAVLARVARVVYGCDDPKGGAVRTLYTLVSDPRLNHRARVRSGVRSEAAADLLSRFFRALRERGPER